MAKFKDSASYSLPIIMKDIHNIKNLNEILESFDDTGVAYSELEDYINNLKQISKDFLSNISNNLKLKGIKTETKEIASEMLDNLVILAPPSSEYNCHGWSLGTVSNVPLSSDKLNLLEEISLYRDDNKFKSRIDNSIFSLFSNVENVLKRTEVPSYQEGSIITYSHDSSNISHSARFLKNSTMYNYDSDLYCEWYKKDKFPIKFSADGFSCEINSYTSKLGLGHLVMHKPETLISLYGELDSYYDISN